MWTRDRSNGCGGKGTAQIEGVWVICGGGPGWESWLIGFIRGIVIMIVSVRMMMMMMMVGGGFVHFFVLPFPKIRQSCPF